MTKFRKKPVVIDAEQYSKHKPLPFRDDHVICYDGDRFYIETLEGPLNVSDGDWVIRGIKGEFYPCKPDIFEATYEPVSTNLSEPSSLDSGQAGEDGLREALKWALENYTPISKFATGYAYQYSCYECDSPKAKSEETIIHKPDCMYAKAVAALAASAPAPTTGEK